jgi:hypothetical protein
MRLHILITTIFFAIGAANAQDVIVKTKLMPVGVAGSIKGLYFRNDGKTAELKASMTGLGEGFEYKGPQVLALYNSEEALAPPKEGQSPPTPLATVKLPNADRILLLMAPPPEGRREPSIRAYPVSTDDLRPGDYRFFNCSDKKIAVILGDERIGIRPGKVVTVKGAKWQREVLDLAVKLGTPGDDSNIRMVYSSVWGHQPAQRNFIILSNGATKAQPIEIRRFHDIIVEDTDAE